MLLGLTNLLWKFQINKVYSECLTRRAAGGTRRAAREPEVFSPALQSELFGTKVPGSECPARFERTPCEESDNFDHILLFI